jgi:hypothetical protein
MKILNQGVYEGERALYNIRDTRIENSTFQNGESPLKECKNLEIDYSVFKWKYPLWYCENIKVDNSVLLDTARSGIWYTKNITVKDTFIEAPKTFRRAEKIRLENCRIPNAEETLWNCKDIKIKNLDARGHYFAMNSENIEIENFTLDGNYAFDGAKNIKIKNAKLLSKDSFWNTENVTVEDSVIIGEYLGWNSKNLRFINCTIDSNQGMCYIENLEMINCRLMNTDLAFELSSVKADIKSKIISVKNPISGEIHAEEIGEIILNSEIVDPEKTKITTER